MLLNSTLHEPELEHENDFLFRRAQVKEDRLARLGELLPTQRAIKDAPLAALGQVGRNRSHIATIYQFIMVARRVGARLVPVLGFPHESVLRSAWSHNLNFSWRTGPFLFQSISG